MSRKSLSRQLAGASIVAAFFVIASSLQGCASVKESYGPDGRKAYALNCSGLARGWDKCQASAGEICGASGYDVIDRVSEDAAMMSAGGNRNSFGASGAKTNERSMLISWRKPN